MPKQLLLPQPLSFPAVASPPGLKISWPTDVLPYVRRVGAYKQKHLVCISLNSPNEVLARTVTIGLVDRVHVHPLDVFADPITDRATAVITAHNHPSGYLTFNRE